MSLQDGTSKMSKSDPNDGSRINLLDDPATIVKKIKRCKTDALQGLEWDNPDRPECTNLLNIYQSVSGMDRAAIEAEVEGLSWGDFKPRLADAVVAHLEPIQKRHAEVMTDRTYLAGVLKDGADDANQVAAATVERAKHAMGFLTAEGLASWADEKP